MNLFFLYNGNNLKDAREQCQKFKVRRHFEMEEVYISHND